MSQLPTHCQPSPPGQKKTERQAAVERACAYICPHSRAWPFTLQTAPCRTQSVAVHAANCAVSHALRGHSRCKLCNVARRAWPFTLQTAPCRTQSVAVHAANCAMLMPRSEGRCRAQVKAPWLNLAEQLSGDHEGPRVVVVFLPSRCTRVGLVHVLLTKGHESISSKENVWQASVLQRLTVLHVQVPLQ
jgi:hypothetical protein